MVNGALLMNKELIIKKHMQYCGMMLAQYYIWRLITINAVAFFVEVPMIEIDKIEILNAVFFLKNIDGVSVSHMWFIPTLFCIYLFFPFYKKVFDENRSEGNRIPIIC